MGGGASKLTLAEAKVHAGALWDEEAQDLFESLAEDSKDGKVGKQRLQKALKQLQGKRAKQQRQDSEVEEAAIAAEAAAAGEGAAAGVTAAAAAAGEAEADGRADRVAAIKAAQTVRHAVTVTILYGSMAATEDTKALLADVGADRIISMTGRFYEKMFADKHLQKFVRKPDDPHADRLGSWIIEKMGGGPVWTSRRPPDARTKAHRDAWTSPRREPEKHGRRFKLDDCRAWMRNMVRVFACCSFVCESLHSKALTKSDSGYHSSGPPGMRASTRTSRSSTSSCTSSAASSWSMRTPRAPTRRSRPTGARVPTTSPPITPGETSTRMSSTKVSTEPLGSRFQSPST